MPRETAIQDGNYWKSGAAGFGKKDWELADKKVESVIAAIKKATGRTCSKVGFGADTTEFIAGSAQAHGFKKAAADLLVDGTNISLEVTGPTNPDVSVDADLWFLPTKLKAAFDDHQHDTWMVHVIPQVIPIIRVLRCDEVFQGRCRNSAYALKGLMLRGKLERFVVIPARDVCVKPLNILLDFIKKL